ncbi:MAG: class I SAM-dependent methyltransferase [Gammaproteobacteria bacterium]
MQDYDSIPYESVPFSETHPRRLAMLGRLFGLATAPPEACRYLELGCASGGNLIPLAWHFPDSEFVGIDLSIEQVRVGQETIARLGLKNIRLEQGDLCVFEDRPAGFDYIVAHGVYSWVPEPVRAALLRQTQRLLAPNGIAYISYNTQPGWNVRDMLRGMAIYHVRDLTEPPARLQSMLELFDFLRSYYQNSKQPLQQQLYLELKGIEKSHPSYLYHDFLEADNKSVLFSEFTRELAAHQLKYLCESELHTMFASTLPPAGAKFVEQYDDMLVQEQYMDHLRQRTFRMSLIVHADSTPDYDIDLTLLKGFAMHSQLSPPDRLRLESNTAVKFTRPDGGPVEVCQPLTKLTLQYLFDEAPAALCVSALQERAAAQLRAASSATHAVEEDEYLNELFNLFANSCIEFVLSPQSFKQAYSDRPTMTALATAEAQVGNVLSGVWHEPIHLDGFAHLLIEQLSGRNNVAAIAANIVARLRADVQLAQSLNIDTSVPEARLQASITTNVKRLLFIFARQGVLE